MLNPVKPVTHCWGSGSCGGASWIFREGGIPGFLVGQEQQGHAGGTVPPQVPLGAAWTFLSQGMENPLEPLVGRQSLFQKRSGELPWSSFPWLCPGPAAPLGAVDGRTSPRSGVWCLPSTLSLILGTFWDFSGVEE